MKLARLTFALIALMPACGVPVPQEEEETQPNSPPSSQTTSSEQVAASVTFAATHALAMVGPMKTRSSSCVGNDDALHCNLYSSLCGDDGHCAINPDQQQALEEKVEQALGASLDLPAGPSCSSFVWNSVTSSGIDVTATFDQCSLPGGHVLDGSVNLAVALSPFTLTIDMAELTLDDDFVDGSVQLNIGGEMGAGTTAALDMLVSIDNGTYLTDFDQVAFTSSASGRSIEGALVVTTPSAAPAVDAEAVTWKPSECHPSSGTLQYQEGGTDVTITFLPKTPSTGIVLVELAPLPPVEQPVLQPCGTLVD